MDQTLPARLDALERADGPAPAPLSRDGWELVLAENVAYLVDDDRRRRALRRLAREIGLTPEAILAADPDALASVCAGMRPAERAERLRTCARLRLEEAPWNAYPGIGKPGAERIEMMAGERAVLALESNGLRALYHLGYGEPARSYSTLHRAVQAAATAELGDDAGLRGLRRRAAARPPPDLIATSP